MAERKQLAAARIQRHWTLEVAAEHLGVGVNTLCRWEKGKVAPQAYHILKLEEVYNLSAHELGLGVSPDAGVIGSTEAPASVGRVATDPLTSQPEILPELYTFIKSDLTLHLMTLAFLPHRHHTTITGRMAHLLEEFDAMHKENEEAAVTRREALSRLAMLPILTLGLNATGAVPRSVRHEDVLTQCSAGIAACGHLSKGAHDEMNLAFSALSSYLPVLKKMVKESSTHRQSAAQLLALGSLVKATISVHRAGEGTLQAARYAQDAILYGEESGDLAIKLTALRRLSWIYSCDRKWQQAADCASQAHYLLEHAQESTRPPISPLIQSSIYGGVAKYMAQNAQTDDVLSTLERAHTTFSEDGELSWWVDSNKSNRILDGGLTYYHLGQYDDAFNILSQAVDPATLTNKLPASSERVRIETINYMTLTTLKNPQKDMELSIRLWTAGIQGASALQSEQRLNEAYTAYDIMEALWPHERRIKELRELTKHLGLLDG